MRSRVMRIGVISLACLSLGVAYASLGIQTSLENNVLTIQKIQISSGSLPTSGWKVLVDQGGIKLHFPTTAGVLKRDPANGYVVEQLLSGTEISQVTNIQLGTGAITSGDIASGTLTNVSFNTGSITCAKLNIPGFSCTGSGLQNVSCPVGEYAYGISSTGALLCGTSNGCTGSGCVPTCTAGQALIYSGGTRGCYGQGGNNSGSLWEPVPGIPNIGKIRNRNQIATQVLNPLTPGAVVNGNVGVGLTGPIATLHVRDSFLVQHTGAIAYVSPITATLPNNSTVTASGGCFITGSLAPTNLSAVLYVGAGKVGILTKTPQYTLDVVGQLRAIQVVTLSDARLKTNIILINSPLALLQDIHGYHYTLDLDGSQQYGLIAQEVASTFPDAVITDANGVKSLDYQGMIAPLIEALRETNTKTDQLEALAQENNTRLQKIMYTHSTQAK